jgi:hypothetical protein
MKKVRANKNSKMRSLRRPHGKKHYNWKWLMPYDVYLKKTLVEVEDPITGKKTGHIFMDPDFPDTRICIG